MLLALILMVTVYDVLKDKHPPGRAADPALVLDVSEPYHMILPFIRFFLMVLMLH